MREAFEIIGPIHSMFRRSCYCSTWPYDKDYLIIIFIGFIISTSSDV